ncbi:hypothetical protein COV11_04535 [Candidatus Woesearchaeota archaeon CG10_big_fil_rev_8_21_14_0_10_30_7]|nr:MAG: hypothetical protein COV11_04535 [Candidatus Woesearchaeota archaeon CG10_big_fil_rev_8_21_14_0_10_30_7]
MKQIPDFLIKGLAQRDEKYLSEIETFVSEGNYSKAQQVIDNECPYLLLREDLSRWVEYSELKDELKQLENSKRDLWYWIIGKEDNIRMKILKYENLFEFIKGEKNEHKNV